MTINNITRLDMTDFEDSIQGLEKTLFEREQETLSKSIIGALVSLTAIAADPHDEHQVADRIDAASRVLAYASAMTPEELDDDDEDDAFVDRAPDGPEGNEDAC
jgi:hypothetical protein